jgi:hypothetical protein
MGLELINDPAKQVQRHGFIEPGHQGGARAHLAAHVARVGRFDVIDDGIPAAERFKGVKRELAIRDFSLLGISHEFERFHEKIDVKHIKTPDLQMLNINIMSSQGDVKEIRLQQRNPCQPWSAEFIRQHLPAKASVPATVPTAIHWANRSKQSGKDWGSDFALEKTGNQGMVHKFIERVFRLDVPRAWHNGDNPKSSNL